MEKRIYLSSPTMHGEEMEYIKEAFETNWIAPLGKNVDAFEAELAQYLGGGHAAALSSGTAGLHLAVKLTGVTPGDIVLCSDFTFAASVNPVCYEKGVPVFIESERETWNMDPRALEIAFEKYRGERKPRAVIVANLYGTPAKLDEIAQICAHYKTPLIEDAAESLSATYKGRQTGTFGQYNVFSFNGNKIITSSGGGMLVSPDEQAIAKARFWATQSRDPAPHYQHSELGYNYRMSNVVAGIGRGQLKHLEEHRAAKEKIFERYQKGLKDLPLTMNPSLSCSEPNYWLSCILLNQDCNVSPIALMDRLADENIEARPIWKPMHLQPLYAHSDYISIGDEVGSDVFSRGLCLPSDIKMTQEEQEKIMEIIRGMLR
ncbi:DegT/DnrJ/EryC1/StrS family aminotransferase [Christensenellaceae bacterium NSJ-44]|uniref:DegT/DnrJ/EryC1/StrS family aminotransferase n=1 Tax=Luoshenia tenuis TaxID=2763654 RepID=A0A926D3A5_9FIRM|nr:DegT/DnrJ/EryC1/StrS family aminotransferase [Luoshenia tenuis]